MKKIISSIFILGLILNSCSKEEKTKIEVNTSQEVNLVGIGKVLPKDGIIPLAISNTNQVIKLYKKIGDTVQAGELIFKMKSISESLNIDKAEVELKASQEKYVAKNFDLLQAETKLKELKNLYLTSQKLYNKKAETKEKVYLDSMAYLQQYNLVNQIKANNTAEKLLLKEKELQLKSAEINFNEQEFRALENGVLLRLDVTLGQVLTPNTVFGELAQIDDLVVEGEIDELYANDIKIGQEVEIYSVGQNNVLAQGKISYVGASLQNKSILYEAIGEGSDRRVRRFTVLIPKKNNNLLINQKVECKIKR